MKKCAMVTIVVLCSFLGLNMLFAAANTWTQKTDFGGTARDGAVGFSIGSKGYIGTGSLSTKDFWEYDPVADTWTQRADFGGTARSGAVGFSIGSKGYVGGTGWNVSSLKDFWEYDPVANTWTKRADFGGSARYKAVGFSIGTKGYIGTGRDGSVTKKDFWEYDPVADTWTQKADFGGGERSEAVGFSLGNKGYIGTGQAPTSYPKDFWEYDPAANTWTRKADFGGGVRYGAVGFSIGTKGYIGTGLDGSSATKDFWEYDPAADAWTQKADFGGGKRVDPFGFSIGTKGFMGTGNDASYASTKDFWEYSPSAILYFPHIATSIPWQTEIAVINTGNQPVTGILKAFSDEGQLVDTEPVALPAHGRRQIIVSNEFTNHTEIGYIVFDTNSDTIQGYTKFYQEGVYRAAIPAIKEVNTSDITISHIASNADWWTGISLVNTTLETKQLTITFSDGRTRNITLNANEHKAFSIRSLFNDQPQPGIKSAVIAHAGGVIGLELFGSFGWGTQLEGILLTDKTASTLYYPHVASDGAWWTGIVAYNPSESEATITITPYSAAGALLPSSTLAIAGKGKYVGAVANLGLPAQTAWFKIDSTNNPFTGFELFGTVSGNQLGAYAGGRGPAKAGVFAKIEKSGWTGIAFVNTENTAASVTLIAYDDNGVSVATEVLSVAGHAKVVNNPELIFMQDIGNATYIAYTSDKNVVGFQLNSSSNGTMLDGLPGM
jgi:hypothetical protein